MIKNIFERYFEQVNILLPEPPPLPRALGYIPPEYWERQILEENSNFLPKKRERCEFLSGYEERSIEDLMPKYGSFVFAFYKSRRFKELAPFPGRWGIFYIKEGVAYLAKKISSYYPGKAKAWCFKRAKEFLFHHEFFHFKFDVYALQVEAQAKIHLYIPLKNFCWENNLSSDLAEEALANKNAFEWAKGKKIGDFAEQFMKQQGGAYSRFNEDAELLAAELAGYLFNPPNYTSSTISSKRAPREDQSLWVGMVPEKMSNRILCPEYDV